MFKKASLFPILFFGLALSFRAQEADTNLHKYWNYRNRLVNEFLVVGPAPGQSIPAGIRNLYNGNSLHYGDAPVYLGYYIGVLATEYDLLKANKQETDHTLTELYYALEAINRLDVRAESLWGKPNGNAEKNGFLLESDVPGDFCKRYSSSLNGYAAKSFIREGQGHGGPVEIVIGGLDSLAPNHSTCSQDHLACLIMGLGLSSRLTGDSLTFTDKLTGQKRIYSFSASSKDIAGRILAYMQQAPFGGRSWILRMPDVKRIKAGDGGNARLNAYGFAQAGEFICGKSFMDHVPAASRFYWRTIYRFPVFARLNPDNLLFGLELASVGDSWKGNGRVSKTALHIRETGDYRASILGLYPANHYGWDVFYEALFLVLHPASEKPDTERMKQILDSAPWNGTFYHGGKDIPTGGWAGSSMRFYDSPPHQLSGKKDFPGNYNGLDYMLFYNLYRLTLSSTDMKKEMIYEMTAEFKRDNP